MAAIQSQSLENGCTMMLRIYLILSFSVLLAIPLSAQTVKNYTILLVGNRAGSQKTEIGNDGSRNFSYEFNDRGRGPKIECRMTLDSNGLPAKVSIRGNDYFKSPIEETFQSNAGKASWKNQSEEDSKDAGSRSFYVSINGVPEELGLLASALLKAPGNKIKLLPEGEAQLEKVGDVVVAAKGAKQKVSHYAISGLSFLPSSVWLTDDETFFASVSPWLTTIEDGWEETAVELQKAQDEFTASRFSRLAKQLSERPKIKVVIQHANLFDSESGRVRKNMTVVISGNRIESVTTDQEAPAISDVTVIDATGKMLLPGLWDMHTHVQEVDGLLHLAAGVTTVRDLANETETILALKKKFDQSVSLGPRVILAGFIDGPGPYAGPSKVLVATEEEARRAVDRYAELGYEQIKIYSSLKPDLVPVIIAQAHKHHLRVSGHVPAYMTAEQVVNLGFDEIQHANFLFLNFLADTVKDTRTPLRFTAVAENAAELDLNSEPVKRFITLLKEKGIVLDPTVNAFEGLFTDRAGRISQSFAMVADRFPAQIRRGFLLGGLPVPEGMDQRYRDSFRAVLKMVKRLHDEGITIVAGTDSLAGFAFHRELELYVEAGIPASGVFQLATLGSARVMGREKETGSIAPGKWADVIVVNGDPISNISDIRKVETVIKDGIIFQSSEIYKSLGIRP